MGFTQQKKTLTEGVRVINFLNVQSYFTSHRVLSLVFPAY